MPPTAIGARPAHPVPAPGAGDIGTKNPTDAAGDPHDRDDRTPQTSVQSPGLRAYRSTVRYQSPPLGGLPAKAFSTFPGLGHSIDSPGPDAVWLSAPPHRGWPSVPSTDAPKRGGFDQTSHFVDAVAFLKQSNRPLAAIFQPIGTTFRSHINEYNYIPLKMQKAIRQCRVSMATS